MAVPLCAGVLNLADQKPSSQGSVNECVKTGLTLVTLSQGVSVFSAQWKLHTARALVPDIGWARPLRCLSGEGQILEDSAKRRIHELSWRLRGQLLNAYNVSIDAVVQANTHVLDYTRGAHSAKLP